MEGGPRGQGACIARLPLLARGRDADVFDRGDGLVLRRYRGRDVPEREVAVMRYARGHGYPVPEVIEVAGPDLVLERVDGPTMQDVLGTDASKIPEIAAQLAELHHRLHRIAAPERLRPVGDGDRLLHLDLHPRNVILSTRGPVVIDWANAARGPAALDPALAIAIFVSAKGSPEARAMGVLPLIDAFIDAFAGHFDAAELDVALPLGIALRMGDGNVTGDERAALVAFREGRSRGP